jgi:hypothetical protein
LDTSDKSILNPYDLQLPKDLRDDVLNVLINGSIDGVLNAAAKAYLYGEANPNLLRITQRRPSWN